MPSETATAQRKSADSGTVITQAAAIGVNTVQFIGGEPTLSPHLPRLIRHALTADLSVNVYSNLVRATEDLWELFTAPGVALSTSWYAANRATHAAITGSSAAYAATRANIARAVELGIPIHAAIIAILPGQHTAAAEAELRALGVTAIVYATCRASAAPPATAATPRLTMAASGRGYSPPPLRAPMVDTGGKRRLDRP